MGRNHRFPFYSSEGLREGEWGSSSTGVPVPSSPRSSGKLNQLPRRKRLPFPWKGQMDAGRKGEMLSAQQASGWESNYTPAT